MTPWWNPLRSTWELNCDDFRITDHAWPGFLEKIKRGAARSLGLSPEDINVEPYKLLLYEKGSFSKRHRDSAKAPGMIGSLIVCLPSKHEGGQVHLSYAGKDRVYATSPMSAFDITALAWYSDVTHKIKEVTAGYRLVLTYTIIQKDGPRRFAGYFEQQQALVKETFDRYLKWYQNLPTLVYSLGHRYSLRSKT